MVRAALVILVAIAPTKNTGSTVDHLQRITSRIAADRLAQCGLGPVTIRHDRESEADILVPARAEAPTNEQLLCAARAADLYDVQLLEPFQARFNDLQGARASALLRQEALTWLSARGLLKKVPPYRPGITNDAAFTHRIERLCGRKATGAFQSDFGFHAVNPDWARHNLGFGKDQQTAFACIMNVTQVAHFEVHFIGNTAATE